MPGHWRICQTHKMPFGNTNVKDNLEEQGLDGMMLLVCTLNIVGGYGFCCSSAVIPNRGSAVPWGTANTS
jgi:hypothetical protein